MGPRIDLRIEDHLGDPLPVSQLDKDETPRSLLR